VRAIRERQRVADIPLRLEAA